MAGHRFDWIELRKDVMIGYKFLGRALLLKPGKHTIEFDFTYDGPGIAKGGTGVMKVDGREFARERLEHTIPFRFTGTIDRVTFKLGPTRLSADDEKKIREAVARAHD